MQSSLYFPKKYDIFTKGEHMNKKLTNVRNIIKKITSDIQTDFGISCRSKEDFFVFKFEDKFLIFEITSL